MTCALTAAEDTDYAPTYSLAPNKWYLKIYINTRYPEKITMGSKCRGSHQRRGITSSTVHSHSKDRLYLPQMQRLVYNPQVDHSQAIHVVLKRSGIKKIGDWWKLHHFGWASMHTRHGAFTTWGDTDYWLQDSLAQNKRCMTLYNDQKKPKKITKGSKWPYRYQRQGARRAPTCTHTHKLYSASLKRNGLYIIHYWSILKQWTKYLKDHASRKSQIDRNPDHSGRPVLRKTMLCSTWCHLESLGSLNEGIAGRLTSRRSSEIFIMIIINQVSPANTTCM